MFLLGVKKVTLMKVNANFILIRSPNTNPTHVECGLVLLIALLHIISTEFILGPEFLET